MKPEFWKRFIHLSANDRFFRFFLVTAAMVISTMVVAVWGCIAVFGWPSSKWFWPAEGIALLGVILYLAVVALYERYRYFKLERELFEDYERFVESIKSEHPQ